MSVNTLFNWFAGSVMQDGPGRPGREATRYTLYACELDYMLCSVTQCVIDSI